MKKIIARDNYDGEYMGEFDSLYDFHRTHPGAEITLIETSDMESLTDEYKSVYGTDPSFIMERTETSTTIYC